MNLNNNRTKNMVYTILNPNDKTVINNLRQGDKGYPSQGTLPYGLFYIGLL